MKQELFQGNFSPHRFEGRYYNPFEVFGNTDLAHAEVIGLGEFHAGSQWKAISYFLKTHAKQGDVVLVEGCPRKALPLDHPARKAYSFSDGLHVQGWDNMSLLAQTLELKRLKEKLKSDKKKLRWNPLKRREREIIDLEISFVCGKFHDIGIIQRNKELRKAINDARRTHPHQRVFIVAGRTHYVEDPSFRDFLKQFKYTVIFFENEDGEGLVI